MFNNIITVEQPLNKKALSALFKNKHLFWVFGSLDFCHCVPRHNRRKILGFHFQCHSYFDSFKEKMILKLDWFRAAKLDQTKTIKDTLGLILINYNFGSFPWTNLNYPFSHFKWIITLWANDYSIHVFIERHHFNLQSKVFQNNIQLLKKC